MNSIFSGDNLPDWKIYSYRTHSSKIDPKKLTLDNICELNSLLKDKSVTARTAQLVKHLYVQDPQLKSSSDGMHIITVKTAEDQSREISVDLTELHKAIGEVAKIAAGWGTMRSILSRIKNWCLGFRSYTSTFYEFSDVNKQGVHVFSPEHLEDLTQQLRTSTKEMIADPAAYKQIQELKPLLDRIITTASSLADGEGEEVKDLAKGIDEALKKVPDVKLEFEEENKGIHSGFVGRILSNSWRFGWSTKDHHALRHYTKEQIDAYLIPALEKMKTEAIPAEGKPLDDTMKAKQKLFLKTMKILEDDVAYMKGLKESERPAYQEQLYTLHGEMVAQVLLQELSNSTMDLSFLFDYTKEQLQNYLKKALLVFLTKDLVQFNNIFEKLSEIGKDLKRCSQSDYENNILGEVFKECVRARSLSSYRKALLEGKVVLDVETEADAKAQVEQEFSLIRRNIIKDFIKNRFTSEVKEKAQKLLAVALTKIESEEKSPLKTAQKCALEDLLKLVEFSPTGLHLIKKEKNSFYLPVDDAFVKVTIQESAQGRIDIGLADRRISLDTVILEQIDLYAAYKNPEEGICLEGGIELYPKVLSNSPDGQVVRAVAYYLQCYVPIAKHKKQGG